MLLPAIARAISDTIHYTSKSFYQGKHVYKAIIYGVGVLRQASDLHPYHFPLKHVSARFRVPSPSVSEPTRYP